MFLSVTTQTRNVIAPIIIAVTLILMCGCQQSQERLYTDLNQLYSNSRQHRKLIRAGEHRPAPGESQIVNKAGYAMDSLLFKESGSAHVFAKAQPQSTIRGWCTIIKHKPSGHSKPKLPREARKASPLTITLSAEIEGIAEAITQNYTFSPRPLSNQWIPLCLNLRNRESHIVKCGVKVSGLPEDCFLAWGGWGVYQTTSNKRLTNQELKSTEKGGNLVHNETLTMSSDPEGNTNPEQNGEWLPYNVMVILVDTVRADALSCYGNPIVHTPYLDWISKKGGILTTLQSSSSWTKAAVGTLFTGTSPLVHGASDRGDRLNNSIPTLAEYFQARGYLTQAVFSNANISEKFGFKRGFDYYQLGERPDLKITQQVIDRLNKIAFSSHPFFFYVHYGDPHFPYQLPRPFRYFYDQGYKGDFDGQLNSLQRLKRMGKKRKERDLYHLRALYWAEVTRTDHEIGKLLGYLSTHALLDKTSVVFVSDHGDEFFEHGNFTHGKTLYNELTHVPCVYISPGITNAQIKPEVVYYGELFHWISRQGFFKKTQGVSTYGGQKLEFPRQQELVNNGLFQMLKLDKRIAFSLTYGALKVLKMKDKPLELYNIVEDPKETENLAYREPVITGYLAQALQARVNLEREKRVKGITHTTTKEEPVTIDQLDDRERDNLRALGYIE